MKYRLAALALVAALPLAPAHAGVDVGVSIGISQPGVYGRIDIGRFPQPVVIAPQPVIIGRPVVLRPEPVYMWVPPGHRKNWRRHCGRYGACGVPVYFVQDRWYDTHVRHHDHHDDDRRRGKGHGKGRHDD